MLLFFFCLIFGCTRDEMDRANVRLICKFPFDTQIDMCDLQYYEFYCGPFSLIRGPFNALNYISFDYQFGFCDVFSKWTFTYNGYFFSLSLIWCACVRVCVFVFIFWGIQIRTVFDVRSTITHAHRRCTSIVYWFLFLEKSVWIGSLEFFLQRVEHKSTALMNSTFQAIRFARKSQLHWTYFAYASPRSLIVKSRYNNFFICWLHYHWSDQLVECESKAISLIYLISIQK